MQALGNDAQEHTASFAQKSKLQEIILADGAEGSFEQLKTVSRPSRVDISPQSRELSGDSLDQNIKTNRGSIKDD